ncbi:hypothetical protein SUDANB51_01056 [Streptomyces sp. enrichment culture]
MSVVLSTASLPATDRTERWHDAVSRAFVPLDVRLLEDDPSPGRIVSGRLGSLRVSHVEAGPQVVTRSRRLIARDGKEILTLTLQRRGSAIKEQDGREAHSSRATSPSPTPPDLSARSRDLLRAPGP